jgi:cephalosporin hydroxylase
MSYESIVEEYNRRRCVKSDIWEHMPLLRNYAAQARRVVEFGVAHGNSTWSLLAGKPEWMRSYDVERFDPYWQEIEAAVGGSEINFEFKLQSSTAELIEPADLLFIDSKHTYEHCSLELRMQSPQVSGFIILHDTTTLAEVGDYYKGRGLWPAIEEFLKANDKWRMRKRYTNCNGLTILERVSP